MGRERRGERMVRERVKEREGSEEREKKKRKRD